MSTLGERLRKLREEKEITQEELGVIVNVQKSAISKYERGHISPDADTVSKLADYFDVSADYLLGRTDIKKYTPQNEALHVAESYDGALAAHFEGMKGDDLEGLEIIIKEFGEKVEAWRRSRKK